MSYAFWTKSTHFFGIFVALKVRSKVLSIHPWATADPRWPLSSNNFVQNTDLRVLLVNRPDTEEPTFLGQSMFGCIIKSTYLGDVPKAKSWDLGAHTGL